ncbi:MAG: transglycosylase SLT domain-containing protein [Myxococcota bacterium]
MRHSNPRRRLVVLGCALLGALAVSAPITEGSDRSAPLSWVLADPGRGLRHAVDALERGEGHLADALLRAVAERHPVIADHAELLRMRLRVEAQDYEGAVAFESAWTRRESPLRPRFYTLLGDAYRALDREKRARAAWEFASVGTGGRQRLADLEMRIARSYLRQGNHERAAERFLEVWTRYPEFDAADAAGAELETLERTLGKRLRTPDRWRRRGDALYRRYHNETALEAYDRALTGGLGADSKARARHQRAETLFRLRRYPEAIEAYDLLPRSDKRRIQRARAQARSGQVGAGARALEKLGADTRGADAIRATYLAALLWDGENGGPKARRLFSEVIRRAPNSSLAASSRWWLGWDAFRNGQHDTAERYLRELAAVEKDPIAALRPRYWRIRVREERGDGDTEEAYAALARDYPFTYYGWRALERTEGPVPPPARRLLDGGPEALGPADLARARILLEAGLVEEAREELEHLFSKARGFADRMSLAGLYAEAGDYSRAQRLMVNGYTEHLARGPVPEQIELWWHAWPAPYEHELRAAQQPGAPSPALVYSIMREESGYRPEVISVSGARGLLQLMPETATRVARRVALTTFEPDDLFRPEVNIQLGSAYLGQLLARFDGYAPAAIGSYNAGPQAVSRWLKDELASEDVWVEQIPYSQTRAYVKRVLRSLHAYRVLY